MNEAEALLETALAHWRRNPDPDLGEAIGALGARCAKDREPVAPSRSSMGLSEAWHTRAALFDPSDLDLLLEPLFQTHMGSPAGKIRDLAQWPLDPRIATRLAELFERNRWTGPVARGVRISIVNVLQHYTSDPGTARRLRRWFVAGDGRHKPYGQLVHARLRELSISHPVPIPDDPQADQLALDCHALAQVPEPEAAPAVGDLWNAVLADPDALETRAVLADALQADGNPRGEFMVLQLMGGSRPSTRERLLLKTWEREWLGELEPYVGRAGNVWKNGLLDRVAFVQRVPDLEVPELGAVTAVHLGATSGIDPLLRAGRLPRLERLTGLSGHRALELEHPTLHHVGGLRYAHNQTLLGWTGQLHKRFPGLRSLSLRWSRGITATFATRLAQTPVFAQLQTVEFPGRNLPGLLTDLEAYQAVLGRGPKRVHLVPERSVQDERTVGWSLEVTADRTLHFRLSGVRRFGLSPTEQLEGFLQQVPTDSVDRVQVTAPKRSKLEASDFEDHPWPIEVVPAG